MTVVSEMRYVFEYSVVEKQTVPVCANSECLCDKKKNGARYGAAEDTDLQYRSRMGFFAELKAKISERTLTDG